MGKLAYVGIEPTLLAELQDALTKGHRIFPDHPDGCVMTFTADFDDGASIDFKVMNADEPYIEPVFYMNDNEVECLDTPHFQQLESERVYTYEGTDYVAYIRPWSLSIDKPDNL